MRHTDRDRGLLLNKNFAITCLAYFLITSSFNLLMPTIPLYLVGPTFRMPEYEVGFVLSSYVLALIIMRPFTGYLVDIFPRKIIYISGAVMFVLSFLAYLFAETVSDFFWIRFVQGSFWAVIVVSGMTISIDIVPEKKRGEGVGLFGMFANLAMAFAPFVAISIFNSSNFDHVIFTALITGIVGIACICLIKVDYKPPKKREPVTFDRFILVAAVPLMFNQFFICMPWGMMVPYAAIYGKSLGILNQGIFFLFFALGIISSRLVSGKLVDRGYVHTVIKVSFCINAVAFFVYAFCGNMGNMSTFVFSSAAYFIGIGYGLLFPALQVLYINLTTTFHRGAAMSTYFTAFDLGTGSGMLIGGTIISQFSFRILYVVCALLSVIALLLYVFNSQKVYESRRLR